MRANKYVYTFMTCEPAIALPVPLYHSVIRVCVCVCARARAYMRACVCVYVCVYMEMGEGTMFDEKFVYFNIVFVVDVCV